MPNTKRKVKFCKKLAADKKIKTSNQKIKNNVANIEIFNDNNDMETEENLEELLSNEAEEELTNNEIEIDENFEWFDNEIEENAEHIYNVLSNNIENALSSSNRPLVYLGNSRTTKYRKKIEAKKELKKMDKH